MDTGLQSDMVAYCIWDEVWICVQLATGGRGGCVFKVAKGISKKIGFETPGRMALAGHFAMIPHLRTYYFEIYPGFLQALFDIPRWSAPHPPKLFFFLSFLPFDATFSSYHHFYIPHAQTVI